MMLIAVLFASCAVDIDDPVKDVQDRLDEKVPFSFSALRGTWFAVSTLHPGESAARPVSGTYLLEVMRDTSFLISDISMEVFGLPSSGRLDIHSDTLRFSRQLPEDSSGENIFAARLTYQGKLLTLTGTDDSREYRFSLLSAPEIGRWGEYFLTSPDSSRHFLEMSSFHFFNQTQLAMDFTSDFYYLTFLESSSAILDINTGGITGSVEFTWKITEDTLYLSQGALQNLPFAIDLFAEGNRLDSIRLWPAHRETLFGFHAIREDRLRYMVVIPTAEKNKNWRDLGFLEGYWRSDTLDTGIRTASGFGNFYDLEFSLDKKVTVFTNVPSAPDFKAWNLYQDSLRLTVDTSEAFSCDVSMPEPGILRLQRNQKPRFYARLTKVDPSGFADDPLSRFPSQSFIHMYINDDTSSTPFYTALKHRRGSGGIEKIEMAGIKDGTPIRAAATVKPGPDIRNKRVFSSGDSGFAFAFEYPADQGATTLHFADTLHLSSCRLRISAWFDENRKMVNGIIEKGCVIDNSRQADSVRGEFRYKHTTEEDLTGNFWENIPVKQ